MSSSIGSIGGLGNNNYLFQMNARPIQQRQDDLFSKIDSDSSSGIDKTEFSAFAKKLSQDSGNSIDVDDVFSTYDTDGDGHLSSDEMKSFMRDNPPPPPPNGMSGGPQGPDDLFAQLDGNSDSGIDKSEFSTFSEKLSEDTGNTINVDDVFSTYDTDGDGSLSTEELKSFMKDNAPPPSSAGPNATGRVGLWDRPEQRPDVYSAGLA